MYFVYVAFHPSRENKQRADILLTILLILNIVIIVNQYFSHFTDVQNVKIAM